MNSVQRVPRDAKVLLRRIVIRGLATAAVLLVICAAVLFYGVKALGDGMCSNTVIAELASPTGKWRAVSFERSCGATTGFSTQVSVLGAREELGNDAGGNLLVATTDRGRAPAGPEGGPEVRMKWVSSNVVELEYHQLAQAVRTSDQANGVRAIHRRFSDVTR